MIWAPERKSWSCLLFWVISKHLTKREGVGFSDSANSAGCLFSSPFSFNFARVVLPDRNCHQGVLLKVGILRAISKAVMRRMAAGRRPSSAWKRSWFCSVLVVVVESGAIRSAPRRFTICCSIKRVVCFAKSPKSTVNLVAICESLSRAPLLLLLLSMRHTNMSPVSFRMSAEPAAELLWELQTRHFSGRMVRLVVLIVCMRRWHRIRKRWESRRWSCSRHVSCEEDHCSERIMLLMLTSAL